MHAGRREFTGEFKVSAKMGPGVWGTEHACQISLRHLIERKMGKLGM